MVQEKPEMQPPDEESWRKRVLNVEQLDVATN
jgi:hypothetical protein